MVHRRAKNVSAEPAASKVVEACFWTARVRLSKFPGPRHSPDRYPDRYPTDTQKLTFGSPGTPINTHSKPGEANEVVRKFHAQAKAWIGEALRPADI